MQCPKCSGTLGEMQRGSVALDNCSSCNGIWLDRNELERLIENNQRIEAAGPAVATHLQTLHAGKVNVTGEGDRKCPRCSTTMEKIAYRAEESEVVADRCASCGGLWFDAGEMGSVFTLVQDEAQKGKGSAWRDMLVIGLLLLGFGGVVAAALWLLLD